MACINTSCRCQARFWALLLFALTSPLLSSVYSATTSTNTGSIQAVNLLSDCESSQTCAPSFCTKVSNAACTFTPSTLDLVLAISGTACNPSCTQASPSNFEQCTTSFFDKHFTTWTGVKAAYCTDKFLVVHSDGEVSETVPVSVSAAERAKSVTTSLLMFRGSVPAAGSPTHTTSLNAVPRPPGGGSGCV